MQRDRNKSSAACAAPDPESADIVTAGLRVTVVRVAVLRLVRMTDGPLDAVEVFQRLSGAGYRVSVAAVYRSLREFELAGLLLREWAVTGHGSRKAAYHARAGISQERHVVHLRCALCLREAVIEEPVVGRHLTAALERAGMRVGTRPLVLQVVHCDCA